MNKIYKVIYSKAKHCYIVASEIAKSSSKSASGSKKKAAALLCAAVLSGGLSVSAADVNVTYDDDTKAKITLGEDGNTVDILGVAGGQVYSGSKHAVNGDDLYKIDQRITNFSGTLDTINTGMAKINASLATNLKDITTLQTTTATIKQKVERGYNFQINGTDVKNATPNDNDVNFTNGSHVTITNDSGALKFSIADNGKVAKGETQFVTGDTVNTAIEAEKTARANADTAINNKIGTLSKDGSYITAQGTISANLTALDTQAKTNATNIANEVSARTKAVNDEATARQNADTAINNKIGTIAKDGSYITAAGTVSANLTALDAQVKTNANAITKEATDRANAIKAEETARTTAVSNEAKARSDADNAINAKIGTMTKDGSYITAQGTISANLTALDTQTKANTTAIAKEVTDRTKAVSDEAAARAKAVSDEATARQNADTALTNKIGTIAKDGSYITAAGTVSANITALDTQVKTNANAITKEATDRANAIKAEETARTTAVSNEAKARSDADNAINAKIGTMTKDGSYITAQGTISANLTALDTQTKANTTAIAKEVTDRTKAVSDEATARAKAVSDEATARTAADNAINAKIGTIAKDGAYIAANGTISANLTTLDTQTKANADAITAETKAREKAITDEVSARNAAIQKETDARTASEATINSKIGTLASGGNYLGKNDSVSDNLLKLDTQTKANADAITKEATDRANAITAAKDELSTKISTLDGNAVKYDDDTKATISLAAKGGTTLTNVKAGALSASSTDAVNGSQLFDTNSKLTKEIADRDAAVKAETKARTDAITAEAKARTDADTAIKNTIGTVTAGSYITANGTIASNMSALDTKLKSTSDALETEITARKADVADLTSKIKNSLQDLSDNAVQYDNDKKGTVTLGGAGGTTITNVKAGTLAANSTEAVNGSQLFDTNTKLAQEVADRTKAVSDEATARANAVKGIQDTIGTLGKDGNFITMKGTIADNLSSLDTKVKANEDAITKEAKDRADAITTAKQEINSTISNLDNNSVKYSNTAKSTIELDGKGGTTISNLKDGTLSESSTEAVSGKQLFSTNTKLAQEVTDRTNAIAKEVEDRNAAIQKEADARTAADNTINNKIGTIAADGSYVGKNNSISDNLSKLDVGVKANKDAIAKEVTDRNNAISAMKDQITGSIDSLTDNAVKYKDGTDKGTVELGGLDGTKITRLAKGTLSADSTDAVNGSQLFDTNTKLAQEVTDRTNAIAKEVEDRNAAIAAEAKARTDADNDIKNNIIGTIKDGTTVKAGSTIADNLGKLDTATKANADAIKAEETARKTANTELESKLDTKLSSLSDNSVQYTDASKDTVKLGGAAGTTITNVKAGSIAKDSMEAINGSQLYESNKRITNNTLGIRDLSNSISSLRSTVDSNSSRIESLSKTVVDINGTVTNTLTDMASMQQNNANLDLSNLSDEGSATIAAIAKNAIKSYLTDTKGLQQNGNGAQTMTMDAVYSAPVAVQALGEAITYDDATKSKITLGDTSQTVDILGVQGGQVYKGSTHAANGDDVFKVQEQVSTFSSSLDTINTGMSKINASLASNLKDITTLQRNVSTASARLNRGYNLDINGVTAKTISPDDNTINFKNGTNVSVSNDNGSIEFTVEGNGEIGKGNTGLISGGTAFTALAEKADKDLSNLTDKAKQNIKDAMGGDLSTKADVSLGNINDQGIQKIKDTMAGDMANKANADLSNISTDGLNKIKDLSKGSVKVVDGNGTKVSTTFDKDGNISYAVNINAGDITKGDTGFVTAGTVKKALDTKANIDLDNLSEAGLAKIKNTMSTDLAAKAATDASNIDAGKYAEKLGTGVVTDGDKNLVTGSTVYNAIKDLQGGQGGLITKVDVDLKNISNEGKTNIKNLSQEAVKVADGKYTTVTSEKDKDGNLTYKVNVTANGSIEDGNTGLITGDIAKKALDKKADLDLANISDSGKKVIKDTVKDDLDQKANKDLSNLTEEAKKQIKDAVSVDLSTKADINGANVGKYASEWAKALGTGKIEKGNVNLVTGDQVFSAVSVKADKSYVDSELSKKANISDVNTALDGKANADLSNITDAGKTAIKDVMKDDLDKKANKADVDKALADKVSKSDFNTVKADVDQAKKDLATKADKSYVDSELNKKADADNVYTKEETDKKIDSKIDSKIEDVKNTITGDMDNKVNKDGSNIDKEKWQEVLGDGKNEAGNKGLISGDTLNKAIDEVRKDGVGLVKQEGDTIKVAPTSDATKVDFKGTDKDGKSFDRVLTGIKTDEDDATSAANVGYVQGVQSNLESQMDAMNSRLLNDIKEAGAVASALAGLHHIDYDPDNKLDFAVATAGYRGKSAAALGAFYQPNENIMFSLAGTIGSNHNAWNMGISFKVGSGSDSPVLSRRVLGNQVQILAKQNQLLAEHNDKLEQDVQELKDKLNALLATATLSPDVQKSIAK